MSAFEYIYGGNSTFDSSFGLHWPWQLNCVFQRWKRDSSKTDLRLRRNNISGPLIEATLSQVHHSSKWWHCDPCHDGIRFKCTSESLLFISNGKKPNSKIVLWCNYHCSREGVVYMSLAFFLSQERSLSCSYVYPRRPFFFKFQQSMIVHFHFSIFLRLDGKRWLSTRAEFVWLF